MESWSSWFKAPVLKTGVGSRLPRVRIPNFPPEPKLRNEFWLFYFTKLSKNSSGVIGGTVLFL